MGQSGTYEQSGGKALLERASEAKQETENLKGRVRPLHDRVLVRRIEGNDQTASGLYIPDAAKDKPQEGEVVAAGKGRSNDQGMVYPLDVQVGDKVLFGRYAGTEIKVNGEELLIMREEEILAVLS